LNLGYCGHNAMS